VTQTVFVVSSSTSCRCHSTMLGVTVRFRQITKTRMYYITMASPSTPPRQGPSPSTLSSPVVRVPKFYDEHKRDEFQAYDVNIHEPERFKSQKAFIEFLGVQHLGLQISGYKFTTSNFVDIANAMAKAMRDKCKHGRSLSFLLTNDLYLQKGPCWCLRTRETNLRLAM
jgi:hypothetical protein